MFSLVTVNRNRLANLLQVLPSWLEIADVSEIVVVDFGSFPPIARVGVLAHKKIKLVTVEQTDGWRIGLAINIGVDHATSNRILKLDSDIILMPGQSLRHLDLNRNFFRGDVELGVSNGQTAFRKQDWLKIGGYNEWLSGYGFDDTDFYQRLCATGLRPQLMPSDLLMEIPQDRDPIDQSDLAPSVARKLGEPVPEKDFSDAKNLFLAYMAPWTRRMRNTYTPLKSGKDTRAVCLAPWPREYYRLEGLAHHLALVQSFGTDAQRQLGAELVTRFLNEAGGFSIRDWENLSKR